MKILAIFTCFNRKELTKRGMATLSENRDVTFDYVILDDNSSDGTREMLKQMRDDGTYQIDLIEGDGSNFWNGGIAISNWSIRENGTDHSQDWWYSYLNQCSVYNTSITSGASGAGHSGNNFAIVYGYVDQYNSSYMTYPSITFRVSTKVSTVWICNSSYTYGVIKNGNHWDDGEDDGWTGSAKPLKHTDLMVRHRQMGVTL